MIDPGHTDNFFVEVDRPDIHSVVPLIRPELCCYESAGTYVEMPLVRLLFDDADLVSGLLVGSADGTVGWLETLLRLPGKRRVRLVAVVHPGGRTQERHLRRMLALMGSPLELEKWLEIRVLPMTQVSRDGGMVAALPPTVIQGHYSESGKTVMSIGSSGDIGNDPITVGSVNFVFRPDDGLRDAWRKWFQFTFDAASPLTEETVRIPRFDLVPAEGRYGAHWMQFERLCDRARDAGVAQEGLIATLPDEGGPECKKTSSSWDEGKTALDPLALTLQKVYASGWLVTVDESTRIQPLRVPVKPMLLGQLPERTLGTVRQRQVFSLRILDDEVDREIAEHRRAGDLLELLSYPLAKGVHWLPAKARPVLEEALQRRDLEGKRSLWNSLGGGIQQFIDMRRSGIREDLNKMRQTLGEKTPVEDSVLEKVMDEVWKRLTSAMKGKVAPTAVYNPVNSPDLTEGALDANWEQPLSLLANSARALRECVRAKHFERRLPGLHLDGDSFRAACDPFNDVIVPSRDKGRAVRELMALDEILESKNPAREKCRQVWQLVTGAGEAASRQRGSI